MFQKVLYGISIKHSDFPIRRIHSVDQYLQAIQQTANSYGRGCNVLDDVVLVQ